MVKRKPGRKRPSHPSSPALRPPARPARHARDSRPDSAPTAPPSNVLFGWHAVGAALANPRRSVRDLMCLEGQSAELGDRLAALPPARRSTLPAPRVVEKADLDSLLGVDAVHQGVAAMVDPLAEISLEQAIAEVGDRAVMVVLDQVTDPHNIGAVMRSAAAFGAEAVILQDRHSPQAGATVAKAASGALDVLPLVRVTNLARALRTLQEAGFWCIGLAEEGARPLHQIDMQDRTALVFGAEGDGLRRLTRETCDLLAHLPTRPPIRSLNVSGAAAIALHQAALARLAPVD